MKEQLDARLKPNTDEHAAGNKAVARPYTNRSASVRDTQSTTKEGGNVLAHSDGSVMKAGRRTPEPLRTLSEGGAAAATSLTYAIECGDLDVLLYNYDAVQDAEQHSIDRYLPSVDAEPHTRITLALANHEQRVCFVLSR